MGYLRRIQKNLTCRVESSMKFRIFAVLLFLLIIPFVHAQVYKITDLGPLNPTALNSWGQVVGSFNGHAVMWTQSLGERDLGILPGGTFSYPSAINDLGMVTGTADGAGVVISMESGMPNQQCTDLTQPFVWSPPKGMQGLGTVSLIDEFSDWCSLPFFATGINDSGQIVGYTATYELDYQWSFLSTNGNELSTFGGGWPPAFTGGTNDFNQIVGQSSIFGSTYGYGQATSWQGGPTLGALGEGVDYASSANAINDLGQIAGWSTTAPISFDGCLGDDGTDECPVHAVIWTKNGVIRDLGTISGDTYSIALRINLLGQAIGSSGNSLAFPEGVQASLEGMPQVIGRPFVWSQRAGMQDLNTLIHAGSGWVLNSVSDINALGQIVGSGTLNGQNHGFLLTPAKL
jgi:uncharacterized membrane protein